MNAKYMTRQMHQRMAIVSALRVACPGSETKLSAKTACLYHLKKSLEALNG